MLRSEAGSLTGFYGAVADEMSRPGRGQLAPVPPPPLAAPAVPRAKVSALSGVTAGEAETVAPDRQLPHPHLLWVQEHLHHLSRSAQDVSAPALRLAEVRQRPWWR